MSDVKPYVPGQTGSLSDVIERGPEFSPATPAGPDGFAAPPSWSQLFTAARPEALRSTPLYDDVKIGEGYAPIVDALGLPASENPGYFGDLDAAGQARFGSAGSPSRLATSARQGEQVPFGSQYLADRSLQESLILSRIKARRLVDKNFLPGVPDDAEGLHQYFEQQQAAKRATGASVLARGSTFGRTTASIAAGGLESALHDPITLPTLLMGGGTASSLIQAAGRDALINGVLAAAEQPIVAHNMAENDEHLTVGDVASSVVSSAAFGAAVGGTVHLATRIPPALFQIMPESVQVRWANRMKVGAGKDAPLLKDVLADMNNRELATFSRSAIGPDRMTPDETAAANVIERNQELGEASPFEPGPMGDAAHNANLADALQRVIDGAPRETLPGAGPLLASASPIAMRPPAPIAAHGADFETQWTAIKGNEHGIGSHGEFLTSKAGAIGPGQVMPGTAPHAAQLAGVPFDDHLYRTDAAYNEKLGRAYYAEQLQTFGDPEMAAAAYNAGPGSAARGTGLRGALRKAAEHGEPGNWRAYLPRETQKYVEDFRRRAGTSPEAYQVGDIGGAADDEALAALQRSADQAEAEGLALSRDKQDLGAADLPRDRADVADVPVLKRELFPSENDWADAQASFHRSLNAPEEPAGAPLSREKPAQGVAQPGAATDVPRASGGLKEFFGASLIADEHGRPLTVYHGSASEFDTFDVARAGHGRGTEGEQALFFSTDPDVASHSAQVAGAGHATNEPTHMGVLSDNGGVVYPVHLRVENPLVSKLKFYNSEEFAKEIARAKAAGKDGVIFPHVVSRGENGTIAVFSPDQVRSIFADTANVRIDDPALKAFDDGANGRVKQTDSLEHDLRLASAEPAIAKKTYSPFGDDRQLTLTELFEELDRERAGVAALRACAGAA